jgi:hypothetical protein
MSLLYPKIKLKKGVLEGYSSKLSTEERRHKLKHLISSGKVDRNIIVKRLNILSIFNKNRSPKSANIFKKDMKYIQKKYPSLSKSKSRTKNKSKKKSRIKHKSKIKSRSKSRIRKISRFRSK